MAKNTAQFCALLGESAEDGLSLNGQPAPLSTTQLEPRVVNPMCGVKEIK